MAGARGLPWQNCDAHQRWDVSEFYVWDILGSTRISLIR